MKLSDWSRDTGELLRAVPEWPPRASAVEVLASDSAWPDPSLSSLPAGCRAPQDVTRLWTDGSLKSEAEGESMPPPSTGGTHRLGPKRGPTERSGR